MRKKKRIAEAGVHGERLEVPDREVATREQFQLQHRLRDASLVGEEHGEGDDAADERDEDDRTRPAEAWLLDQREHDPAEPRARTDGAEVVDAACRSRERWCDRGSDEEQA